MKFLLDTNVISEVLAPHPAAAVARWFASVTESDLALSVISIAEIRFGIEIMPDGKRRRVLNEWLNAQLPARFSGRLLPVSQQAADAGGHLLANARHRGHNGDFNDALIAGTALVHSLSVVTRNAKDFELLRAPYINPWK